jgi:hypothetical protein
MALKPEPDFITGAMLAIAMQVTSITAASTTTASAAPEPGPTSAIRQNHGGQ